MKMRNINHEDDPRAHDTLFHLQSLLKLSLIIHTAIVGLIVAKTALSHNALKVMFLGRWEGWSARYHKDINCANIVNIFVDLNRFGHMQLSAEDHDKNCSEDCIRSDKGFTSWETLHTQWKTS